MELLDMHLGKPLTRGALTIFPIWNGNAVARPGYDLHSDHLAVAERSGSAVVAELIVSNSGLRPLLVLGGDLLEGGLQHRVADHSLMVGSRSAEVLNVSCVEQGRWSGATAHARSGRKAPPSVQAAERQDQTWARVRGFEERYGGCSTGSLIDATLNADVEAARLIQGVRPLPFQSGVLLCLAGQPMQFEAYDSSRTLASEWDALLHAAALDALSLPPIPTPGRRARRFLSRTAQIAATSGPAGEGTRVQGCSPYARMDSLVWHKRVVHAVAINTRHQLVAG